MKSVLKYMCIYMPRTVGYVKMRTFNKANSLVLNPTVEMNRETFHRGAPTQQGEKHAYAKRAPQTLISFYCFFFFFLWCRPLHWITHVGVSIRP